MKNNLNQHFVFYMIIVLICISMVLNTMVSFMQENKTKYQVTIQHNGTLNTYNNVEEVLSDTIPVKIIMTNKSMIILPTDNTIIVVKPINKEIGE